jgi:uncharacterized membrane protein
MKVQSSVHLNDVSFQSLLVVVLTLQFALWIVMGLNALGWPVTVVQQLIGFVYLTFVPGILVLSMLRLYHLRIAEIVLYTVGLSVTVVMLVGLLDNIVFSVLNIIQPFSFLAVTSSVSFVVLTLCAIAYFRNRAHPKPLFNTKMSAPLAPILFLCIIPFITVFSTYLVNIYNVDAGQLLLYLILGIVVLLVAFDKVPSKLYSLAVFVIALSLLFQRTLISSWLTGWDIQVEWSLANSVLKTGIWNPNLWNNYDSLLSIVALAPIYSLISSLDLVWVFKLVYPVIFALVPVGLYELLRKQLNDKVAFLSSFFFMSISTFFLEMPAVARQEVAELFCVLMILVLVSKEMSKSIQRALFIVFGLSLTVSHYSLTYIFVLLLFVTWLVLTVARVDGSKLKLQYLRTKIGIHKEKQVIAPSPKSPPSAVPIVPILLIFIASTTWYLYTSQGSILQSLLSIGSNIWGSVGDFFKPTYNQGLFIVEQATRASAILHRVNQFMNYLNQFLILAGVCLIIFLRQQRFKLQFAYVVLSTTALGFLIASVVVPFLGAQIDATRTYQIMLIFLAPFLAIGFIEIGQNAGVAISKVKGKLRLGNSSLVNPHLTRLLAIYLVLFMLFSTGFLYALTEGYQTIALNNQIDDMQFNHQEIAAATWQTSNAATTPLSGKSVTIYHYFNNILSNDTTNTTNSDGQIAFTQAFSSAGPRYFYATFAGDDIYGASTSAVVNVNVGSSQGSSQATTNSSVAQNITLSASTTTPAVGQPVTFTATLTSEVVYGDVFKTLLIETLGGQGLVLPYPQNASGFYIFLGTYNIENSQAYINNLVGVNTQDYYVNVTPFITNTSLIYSNGGADVYWAPPLH